MLGIDVKVTSQSVVCFAALQDSFLKSQAKKSHLFLCIPIFDNFKKFLTIKSVIGVNAYALTLNKNLIF